MPLSIFVGSQNPVKVQAAKRGFEMSFPEHSFQAVGCPTESSVSDQPMSEEETLQGAIHRAEAVSKLSNFDFAVGIEGGISTIQGQYFTSAWIVIIDHHGNRAQARSGCFALPPRVKELIDSGMELGDANDTVFSEVNSKHKGGAVGSLTQGLINRQQLYEHAMVLALACFQHRKLFRLSP